MDNGIEYNSAYIANDEAISDLYRPNGTAKKSVCAKEAGGGIKCLLALTELEQRTCSAQNRSILITIPLDSPTQHGRRLCIAKAKIPNRPQATAFLPKIIAALLCEWHLVNDACVCCMLQQRCP